MRKRYFLISPEPDLGGIRGRRAFREARSLTFKPGTKKGLAAHSVRGRSRDVSWTTPACTGGEARLGASANALELRIY